MSGCRRRSGQLSTALSARLDHLAGSIRPIMVVAVGTRELFCSPSTPCGATSRQMLARAVRLRYLSREKAQHAAAGGPRTAIYASGAGVTGTCRASLKRLK